MSVSEIQKFLVENSKLNAQGDARTVTQTGYFKLAEDTRQIKRETLEAVADFHKDVITASMGVASLDVADRLNKLKESGEEYDPTKIISKISISRPDGQLITQVAAEKVIITPGTDTRPMERNVKHGVTMVRVKTKSLIDGDAAQKAEELITKLMNAG